MLSNGQFQEGDTVQVVKHYKLTDDDLYDLYMGVQGEGYVGMIVEDQTTYIKNEIEYFSKNVLVRFPKAVAEIVGSSEIWLPFGCLVCTKSYHGKVLERVKSGIGGVGVRNSYKESIKY